MEETSGLGLVLEADFDLDARVRITEHVVHQAFATETVMLNLKTGQYHGIDPLGARMLDVLQASDSVRAAVGILAKELQREAAELEAMLARFCRRLAALQLVRIDGPDAIVDHRRRPGGRITARPAFRS